MSRVRSCFDALGVLCAQLLALGVLVLVRLDRARSTTTTADVSRVRDELTGESDRSATRAHGAAPTRERRTSRVRSRARIIVWKMSPIAEANVLLANLPPGPKYDALAAAVATGDVQVIRIAIATARNT